MSDITKAQKYLETFGYIESAHLEKFGIAKTAAPVGPLGLRERVMGGSKTRDGLALFQSRFNLAVTGEPDAATLALMSASHPRCGVPDVAYFVTTGSKWPSGDITYSIRNVTPDLAPATVQADIASAFKLWSDVADLNFGRTNGAADIEISFVRGEHGDGNAFDGPSGILAHAYFPASGIALAGDVHMDEDEDWRSTDMLSVIAHEFGHSLGLNHSFTAGALMYPYYSGPHRFLHEDDKQGIISIYGAAVAPPPPPPPPAPPPIPPPAPPVPPPPADFGDYVIDISYHRLTEVQARALKENASVQGVVQCLWTGNEQPAPRVENLRVCQFVGLPFAGYISLVASHSGAFDVMQGQSGCPRDLWEECEFVAIDVELPGLLRSHVESAARQMAEFGHSPLVYTSYNQWHNVMGNPTRISGWALWNASWDGDPDIDYQKLPYGGWTIDDVIGEQWSGGTDIEGVHCDRNSFRVGVFSPVPAPPPEPPPEPPPPPPPGAPTPTAIGVGIRFSDGTVKEIHVWP